MTIAENLREVGGVITRAAARSSRDPADVSLIAVSKGQPTSAIREAYAAGHRHFGESYAQELSGKRHDLTDLDDLRWHFIGHLQRNKVRDVVHASPVVHTVDRESLAEEIDRRAQRQFDVLIEVNLAAEPQKAGARPAGVAALAAAIAARPRLRLVGLMAIPPAAEDPERSRPFFAQLRELLVTVRAAGHEDARELSMGMSADFEIAVEEGATLVRVGTAIFGSRGGGRVVE